MAQKRRPNTSGNTDSDQDRSTRGIRDIEKIDPHAGEFAEIEINPSDRRDPEESRHNEAGQRVVTQGDLEIKELRSTKNDKR